MGALTGVGDGAGVAYGRAGESDGEAAGVTKYTGPFVTDGTGVGVGTGGGVTGEDFGNGVAYGCAGVTGTG